MTLLPRWTARSFFLLLLFLARILVPLYHRHRSHFRSGRTSPDLSACVNVSDSHTIEPHDVAALKSTRCGAFYLSFPLGVLGRRHIRHTLPEIRSLTLPLLPHLPESLSACLGFQAAAGFSPSFPTRAWASSTRSLPRLGTHRGSHPDVLLKCWVRAFLWRDVSLF